MKKTVNLAKKRKSIWKDLGNWELFMLCVPALIAYIMLKYLPMIFQFVIPFKDYKFSRGIWGSEWVGLDNFKWLLTSSGLHRAIRNTFLYGVWFLFLQPAVRVTMALFLFEIKNRKALKFYQTCITFPNFMSYVIVGYITYALFSPTNGVLNWFISLFGGQPVDVYMTKGCWPLILTVVAVWKGLGMGSMLYYASLMGIDPGLFEAAELDGAGRWQKMRYISIPHLMSLVCIQLIMNIDDVVKSGFDLYYIIPRDVSGLYPVTEVLGTYTYRALVSGTYSMGTTVGLVQSVVGLILVLLANALVTKIDPDKAMF